MAVDSFQKRMSAKYVLDSSALGVVVTDTTVAVDQAERQSAARVYEGIPAGAVAEVTTRNKGLLLGVY
jgi:hypothetical protein